MIRDDEKVVKKPVPQTPSVTPEVVTEDIEETSVDRPWRVILYNDDIHTFDEVINQLMLAIACSRSHAESLAWRVHTKGKAVVKEGDFDECFRVQSVLRQIELVTELRG